MKYNGFYYWMFQGSMKKVLAEKYGKAYAAVLRAGQCDDHAPAWRAASAADHRGRRGLLRLLYHRR